MKKGLNAWTFPNEVPMEKRIEITAKAGYDGFECLYEKEGYVGMNSTDAELKLVRKKAEDLGLKIPSIVGAHYEGLSLASGDPKEAAEARERVYGAGRRGRLLQHHRKPVRSVRRGLRKLGQERGRARADRQGRGRKDRH